MDYKEYITEQNNLEWLYDFHPEFFEELSGEHRTILEDSFLYHITDNEYPESIESYYNEHIKDNEPLIKEIETALEELNKLAGIDFT